MKQSEIKCMWGHLKHVESECFGRKDYYPTKGKLEVVLCEKHLKAYEAEQNS